MNNPIALPHCDLHNNSPVQLQGQPIPFAMHQKNDIFRSVVKLSIVRGRTSINWPSNNCADRITKFVTDRLEAKRTLAMGTRIRDDGAVSERVNPLHAEDFADGVDTRQLYFNVVICTIGPQGTETHVIDKSHAELAIRINNFSQIFHFLFLQPIFGDHQCKIHTYISPNTLHTRYFSRYTEKVII
jgi:hypothetical protein